MEASFRGAGETVLVADDNPLVLKGVSAALTAFGYRVLEADCGPAAVAIADREPGPIDLVLADVVMPSMTTDELEKQLMARRPQTALAFMSGFIPDDRVRRHVLHGPRAFLQKPFTTDTLARTVRRLLDAHAA